MPELPEVETVRRGLDRHLVGRRITRVEVGRERVVRRTSREELIAGLTDTVVLAADRRGKYLLCPLDSGESMMIHLRMTGQVLLAEGGAVRPPHTHVVMHLDDGREAWFVDPRTFGEVVVFDPDLIEEQLPGVAALGVDPIADEFPRTELRRIVRSTSRALKPLLLDQHVIAGIGNIYADEVLHRSRLRPDRAANSIDAPATWRMHDAIVDILSASIAAGGSTLGDNQYVDLMGQSGSYQDDHRVYGRTGERCSTCGRGWIRRTVSGGRSTHFCPVCQR
ncbi:bifunctional DNA-formamidopyrimidine glycosylase/DNA-(apurinic or apyrimidinic site) lyase [Ilumatobacter nonamiensis]|uniref:bifunctional DNA-formamidopyrimidine glycosylase/DNA-(apurinic or apyrimidinic site) lyase n=1 Tax=Ilumatobacter nonamiensis TaxID=467093 RepID=UPI00034D4D08|nr:bifunctional DNA-formamidopyrimidine glycosylase/DNA-(apurinic or apyrimidinic site) lyase [Ilumatobacter nonamiensis]